MRCPSSYDPRIPTTAYADGPFHIQLRAAPRALRGDPTRRAGRPWPWAFSAFDGRGGSYGVPGRACGPGCVPLVIWSGASESGTMSRHAFREMMMETCSEYGFASTPRRQHTSNHLLPPIGRVCVGVSSTYFHTRKAHFCACQPGEFEHITRFQLHGGQQCVPY